MSFWKNILGSTIKDGAEGVVKLGEGIKTIVTGKLPPKEEAELMLRVNEIINVSNKMQNDINLIEAQSDSFFKSGWRPAVGWMCTIGMGIQYLLFPILGLFMKVPAVDFSDLIALLIGLLGMGGLRTLDKKFGTV
jgi:hypothetical protein